MAVHPMTVQDVVSAFPDILGTLETNPPKPYTVIRAVGSGVSGTAFLLRPSDGDRNVIGKITDLSALSEKKKSYARSEIQCLSQCDHFAIIRHIDSAETPDQTRLLLLMELADAGDLAHQIKPRAKNHHYFAEHEVAFLFLQIVLAVDYMHRRGILHRDIKSANVFLMSCGIVKIGDLGFSQKYADTVSGDVGRTFCGTPYYLAPELWRRHRYSKKADVWSLGVLLYEMASLKRPFVAGSMIELYDRVIAGEYEPLPQIFSQDMCDVVRSMLAFDPEARPATLDILAMPYMRIVAQSFESKIAQNANISAEEKSRILTALRDARPTPIPASPSAAAMVPPPEQRTVQKRGVVAKLGTGGWKNRYLLLAGGVLTISAVESCTVGDTKNLHVLDIQGATPSPPQDVGGRVGCFCIVLANSAGSRVHFQASNGDEAASWVDVIERELELAAVAAAGEATVASSPVPNEPSLSGMH